MCYNLPVLNAILKNNDARALYLFPTKALSADQVSELYELIEAMDVDVKTFTYDGDTPAAARRQVRQAGAHRRHQSGYAAFRHSAAPHQMGQAV